MKPDWAPGVELSTFYNFIMELFKFDYNIKAGEKEYLSDIITEDYYDNLFSGNTINILNKGKCGNGGTTGFINYSLSHNKGAIIFVPNVSIVKSKADEYKNNDNVVCVCGDMPLDNLSLDTKVIIATYDQIGKLLKMQIPYGFDCSDDILPKSWCGRTIIIDEYHKLVDDSSYRDICFEISEKIITDDNGVILMSATPHYEYIDYLRKSGNKDVLTYNIEYDTNILYNKINLVEVKKSEFKRILNMSVDKQTVVFYNSIKSNNWLKEFDCEILCSETKKDELGSKYSNSFNKDKKLHFFTSAYYTGMDINIHINNCYIIVDKGNITTMPSEREIKQMVGRFRKGVSTVVIVYLKSRIDNIDYASIKTQYEELEKYLKHNVDNLKVGSIFRKDHIRYLNKKDEFDLFDKYKDIYSFKTYIESIGFYDGCVKLIKGKELEKILEQAKEVGKTKQLELKKVKEMVVKGLPVTYSDYKYAVQLKAYYKEFGESKFKKASRSEMVKWYDFNKKKDSVNYYDKDKFNNMINTEQLQKLGIKNGYVYKANELRVAIKDIIGIKVDYNSLGWVLFNEFNVTSVIVEGQNNQPKRNKYLVLYNDQFYSQNSLKPGCFINKKSNNFIPEIGCFRSKNQLLVSVSDDRTDGATMCHTEALSSASYNFKSLTGIYLYDWIMEDKKKNLPHIKETDKDRFNKMKFYNQTQISEMYSSTITKKHRFIKSEMDSIDSIILDIDDSISYSEFCKMYSGYAFCAYPTISNTAEDWNKFRVIFPLKSTIHLTGEFNNSSLMVIRKMFCPYEDPNHQFYSFINMEDWTKRDYNEGEFLEFDQETVDLITGKVSEYINQYKKNKNVSMVKKTASESISDSTSTSNSFPKMSLDEAIQKFADSFSLGDGKRHNTLFRIKNGLKTEEERKEFGEYLLRNYNKSYYSKWKSHKVV